MLLAEIIVAVSALEGRAGARAAAPARRPRPSPTSSRSAQLLYSRYLFPFEIAGLILLVAMIGAIVLTHRSRGDTRTPEGLEADRAAGPDEAISMTKPGVGEGMKL